MPRKKVSFHLPFQLFLPPKNEWSKKSINKIYFHGQKSHIGNTVGINKCRLFIHLNLFFLLLLEDNHLKCVANVMLKLNNSRNFSFARFLVGLLKYKPVSIQIACVTFYLKHFVC